MHNGYRRTLNERAFTCACYMRVVCVCSSVWFAYSLRIGSVRYRNSNIAHGLMIQHPMNMFLYHQVQSILKFVMHTHYYITCASLALISSAIVLILFANCLKTYRVSMSYYDNVSLFKTESFLKWTVYHLLVSR